MSFTSVCQNALQLPIKDRAALVDCLVESIDSELNTSEEIARLRRWASESEERIDAVDRGELKTVHAQTALANMRSVYG